MTSSVDRLKLIERIGEIVHGRHERGFVLWPLVDGARQQAELREAISALAPVEAEPEPLYTHPNPSPTSAENAPVGPSAAREGWRCFHCDETFATEHAARLHFGADEACLAVCQIKGAEGGLVEALRRAEQDCSDAWHAVHNESTDAAKAYYAQTARHQEQLRSVEQVGYDRGLVDGRKHHYIGGTDWTLVPFKHTEAMERAFYKVWLTTDGTFSDAYDEVLAASPTPPPTGEREAALEEAAKAVERVQESMSSGGGGTAQSADMERQVAGPWLDAAIDAIRALGATP